MKRTRKLCIESENYVSDYMSSDLYAYYVEPPDEKFFIMVGRHEFARKNGDPTPYDVEFYFSEFEQCKGGKKVPIYMEHDYSNPDFITVRIKVEDIPAGTDTIVVEYG